MCGEHVHFSTQQLNSSHRLTANLSMGMGCKNYANFIQETSHPRAFGYNINAWLCYLIRGILYDHELLCRENRLPRASRYFDIHCILFLETAVEKSALWDNVYASLFFIYKCMPVPLYLACDRYLCIHSYKFGCKAKLHYNW